MTADALRTASEALFELTESIDINEQLTAYADSLCAEFEAKFGYQLHPSLQPVRTAFPIDQLAIQLARMADACG